MFTSRSTSARSSLRARRFALSGLVAAWVALILACGGAANKPTSKNTKPAKDEKAVTKKADAPPQPTAKERWIALGNPSLDLQALKAGDLGVMPVAVYTLAGEQQKKLTGWKVLQVLDKQSVLVTHVDGYFKELNGETFWLEGLDTRNMPDGRTYSFDGIFECQGTRTYKSALGATRTVFVLRYIGER